MKNAERKNFLLDYLRAHMEIMILCAKGGHMDELDILMKQKELLLQTIKKYD